jgi:hypothetical protein
MTVAGLQHQCAAVARNRKQPGMTERYQAGVANQYIEREREHGEQQKLARDIDVIGIAHPHRQGGEQCECDRDRGVSQLDGHATFRPNRPCGRSTRTSSMGRKRIT